MLWLPLLKYLIIPLIMGILLVIFGSIQPKVTKKFRLKKVNTKLKGHDIDGNAQNSGQTTFQGSISNLILKQIDEMEYILVSKDISDNLDYEIIFVNFDKKTSDIKSHSTYIKLRGNDQSYVITYNIWSDEFAFGQNLKNEDIAQEFLKKLKEKVL
jgi:hypothetical protein